MLCCIPSCPHGAGVIIPCLIPRAAREQVGHLVSRAGLGSHVQGPARQMHRPGGSWKRLTTLFSGVLKKAVAMELYSPSAQKS